MASLVARSLLTATRQSLSSVVCRSTATGGVPNSSSLLFRIRPLVAAASGLHFRRLAPALSTRGLSTRQTTSSLNDPNPNWSNRPPKETILLDGCDFEHWLVVMEKPEGDPTRDEIIDSYIKTLAMVVGSEEEARMKIYSVSTRHYFAFGALVSEELSYKLKELPKVRWVLPDSYLDVKNKDYGGEPFINGQAVPYDPKYHEEWVRNNARANERNRRNDRPRNFDRSRNFERRRDTPMGGQSPGGGPGGNFGGQPNMGLPPPNAPQPGQPMPPNMGGQPMPPNMGGQPNYGGGMPPQNLGGPPNNMRGPPNNAPGYPYDQRSNTGGAAPYQPAPGPNQQGYAPNVGPPQGYPPNVGGGNPYQNQPPPNNSKWGPAPGQTPPYYGSAPGQAPPPYYGPNPGSGGQPGYTPNPGHQDHGPNAGHDQGPNAGHDQGPNAGGYPANQNIRGRDY